MNRSEALSRSAALFGPEAMERLAHARVLLFGVGGVGSWCAEALVRSGVGHLTIVDDDVVVPSNLNRQLPATLSTLGVAKVDALAQRLADLIPNVDIRPRAERFTSATAEGFDIASYDCVIDAIDSVADKAALMVKATGLRVPVFSSMGAARRIDPTRVKVAEFRKVQGCALARALRSRFKRSDCWPSRRIACVYSDEPAIVGAVVADSSPDVSVNPSFCPVTATFGMTLAACVIKELVKN